MRNEGKNRGDSNLAQARQKAPWWHRALDDVVPLPGAATALLCRALRSPAARGAFTLLACGPINIFPRPHSQQLSDGASPAARLCQKQGVSAPPCHPMGTTPCCDLGGSKEFNAINNPCLARESAFLRNKFSLHQKEATNQRTSLPFLMMGTRLALAGYWGLQGWDCAPTWP